MRILRNHLFDFLWAFAVSSCSLIILDIKDRAMLFHAFCGVLAFEILMELSQALLVFPGTFDVVDIFTELTANIIIALYFNRRIVQ